MSVANNDEAGSVAALAGPEYAKAESPAFPI